MRSFRVPFLLVVLGFFPVPVRAGLNPMAATPPVAKKVPKTDVIHGETRVDNYFWLREKKNPEVLAYLKAEDAYADAALKPTKPLQEKLYQEMLGHIRQTDLAVPYREGEFFYYSRTIEGKQYPLHARKRGSLDAPEEVLLDLNELAKGHPFLGLGQTQVSDDGNLLAYALDFTAFREYTLFVKDLKTGQTLPDRAHKVSSINWCSDNKTLFYITDDATKRASRLYRHVMGGTNDTLVYEEKDPQYRLSARRSRDKKYLLITSSSATTSEVRYVPGEHAEEMPRVLLPRASGIKYSAGHRDSRWYLLTNQGAKNYRLVTTPVDAPGPEGWKELIAHAPDVFLEHFDLFANNAVVQERSAGLPRFRVVDLATGTSKYIPLPDAACAVFPDHNPEYDPPAFRFRYQSPITPDSVYDYDFTSGGAKLLKRTEVPGGFDPARYSIERLSATASDGTAIPITVVAKRDLPKDGTVPLLLYGYGAYGFSLPLTFDSNRLSLLDRGVRYAFAHIRGGHEMGEVWHDQGKMMAKRNTFTDFIAAADHLVANLYTSRDRLAIEGGSAGGLLIGAVLNFRPDLCRAAVLHVPFVDVINTMLDESLPLTTEEFLEWGNPKIKAEYDYMKSYCPYTNLSAREYPSILVRTSLNDSQVMYWEPAKYVAKLRSVKTDHHPLLFKVNLAGGHGGSSGRYDSLRERALTYAFVLYELGIMD